MKMSWRHSIRRFPDSFFPSVFPIVWCCPSEVFCLSECMEKRNIDFNNYITWKHAHIQFTKIRFPTYSEQTVTTWFCPKEQQKYLTKPGFRVFKKLLQIFGYAFIRWIYISTYIHRMYVGIIAPKSGLGWKGTFKIISFQIQELPMGRDTLH